MMRILALMFHGHVGEGIDDAAADPDGDRTEAQFVEPLFARRQGIFPDQHTAVVPEDSIWPADFLDDLLPWSSARHSLSSFDSDLMIV